MTSYDAELAAFFASAQDVIAHPTHTGYIRSYNEQLASILFAFEEHEENAAFEILRTIRRVAMAQLEMPLIDLS